MTIIKMVGRGLRGEGFGEFVRRMGEIAVGSGITVPPGSTDAEVLAIIFSAFAEIVEAAGYSAFQADAAATGNINVSNPGTAVFDGVTLANGQSLFLPVQTAGAQDGLYIFNGSGSALTRRTDFDQTAEVVQGSYVRVLGGEAQAGAWVLVTPNPITVGTTAQSWTRYDVDVRAMLAKSTGSRMVGHDQTTAGMKLDDWKTPAQKGVDSDGGDATAAIDAILAEGKHLVIPQGHSYLTSTEMGHVSSFDKQIVDIDGTLTHDGTDHDLDGFRHGFWSIFRGGDTKERLQYIGNGTINGARTTWVTGHKGSGIWLMRNPQAYVDGLRLEQFIENGCSIWNTPDVHIGSALKVYAAYNAGLEIRSYPDMPIAGWPAWTGDILPVTGKFFGTYEAIDDELQNAGNGCGIVGSSLAGAPQCHDWYIDAKFLDCLTAVQLEFNDDALLGLIIYAMITGNIRGADEIECSDGVSLINVQQAQGAVKVRNQSNFAPLPGSLTAGLNLIHCVGVKMDLDVETDTDIDHRMQYALNVLLGSDIEVKMRAEGMAQTPFRTELSPVGLRIEGGRGAADDTNWDVETWGRTRNYYFSRKPVTASATDLALYANGQTDFLSHYLETSSALVGFMASATTTPAGDFTIKFKIAGTEQTVFTLDQDDFTGVLAQKLITAQAADMFPALSALTASVTTDADWPSGGGLMVWPIFDTGLVP